MLALANITLNLFNKISFTAIPCKDFLILEWYKWKFPDSSHFRSTNTISCTASRVY